MLRVEGRTPHLVVFYCLCYKYLFVLVIGYFQRSLIQYTEQGVWVNYMTDLPSLTFLITQ